MAVGGVDSLEGKIRAIEAELGSYALSGDGLGEALGGLHDLLETDKTIAYSLRERDDGDLAVDLGHVYAFPADRWRALFDAWLEGKGVDFARYNPLRPEPEQRNRVLSADELRDPRTPLPAETELYPRIDARGHDTLRVLVCDGASLLGWVGLVQDGPPTERQRTVLTRLVPALRRRLAFERLLREARLALAGLPAALEEIPGAAYVIDPAGRLVHANAAGRASFDAGRRTTVERLRAVARGREAPGLRVTRVRDGEHVRGAIVLANGGRGAEDWQAAAARMGLTPAQTRVLDRILHGLSNAAIAAELGVAERTIEAHVTAILQKAQVPSRAALIATLLRGT